MFPALRASEKVLVKGRDLTFESEAVTQRGAGETCRRAFAVLERAGFVRAGNPCWGCPEKPHDKSIADTYVHLHA